MGIGDAWRVFRFETRRYLRWRPLRRWMFWVTATSLLGSFAALWLLALSERVTDAGTRQTLQRFLFAAWYALPSATGLTVALSLTPRLIQDATRRGALFEMYLTELHPFGVVLGKVLAVAALSGLSMAAASPPSVLAAAYGGIPLTQWAQSLVLGWFALLLSIAVMARLQWRAVPEIESLGTRRFAPPPLSAAATTFGALGVYAFLYSIAHDATKQTLLMLIGALLPFGAMLFAGSEWAVGGLLLPMSLVVCVASLGGALVVAAATAQWLGWWSAWGYRLQRTLGGGLYLTLAGIGVALWADAAVGFSAQRVYYDSLLIVGALGYWLARFALGVHGVGRGASPRDSWGGVLHEWLMFGLSATILYGAVWLSRGTGLPPLWAAAVAFYYGCLLLWIQEASIRTHTARRAALLDGKTLDARQRVQMERAPLDDAESALLVSIIAMWFVLSSGFRNPLLMWVLYYPILVTPLGGLLGAGFEPWAYALYGVYALSAAGLGLHKKLKRFSNNSIE